MNSTHTFDIIVIGAGSGGLNIAGFMNRAGFRVLLVDKSDAHIGGDCLNFGCIPSKALIHIARMVHEARNAESFGLTVHGEIDWPSVRAYIKAKQDTVREHENASWFRNAGMTVVLGAARFASPNSIEVNGTTYAAKKIVIATGSRPRMLTGQGIERVTHVLNNENVFDMVTLPKRLLVIGGGPIGIEIAQSLQFLGSRVTVVVQDSHILSKEDPEIANVLQMQMVEQGVTFLLEHSLTEFSSDSEALCTHENGEQTKIAFDAVFVGIGRILNTEGLALEKAGIERTERGDIKVDAYLRTSNKNVFLCGDVAGNYQFTHAAEMHASVILKNFFSPFKKKFNGDGISWTTYTTPEIATFGIQEQELKKQNIPYTLLRTDFTDDDRAITDAYTYGKSKLFISPSGKILGGTMVAPNAGELIQELVLAQSAGLSIDTLFNKTYAYPTASRVNKRIVSTHIAKKLTLAAKKMLKFLY